MVTEDRGCAAEWEWRFTHDEHLIQEWQAAIDEVRRFNAEEKRKQREAELAEAEEEAPHQHHPPLPEVDYETLGLPKDWGLVKGAKIDGQQKYARIFIRRRPAA